MKKYVGTKIITAKLMNLGDYNNYREWTIPLGENPNREGYLVEYEDGYQSWSPKEIFESAYRRTNNMNFGLAIEAARKGAKIARSGWNGNGMCLMVQTPDENSKITFSYLYISVPGCKEGTRLLPWQPAQVDLFQDDWFIIE